MAFTSPTLFDLSWTVSLEMGPAAHAPKLVCGHVNEYATKSGLRRREMSDAVRKKVVKSESEETVWVVCVRKGDAGVKRSREKKDNRLRWWSVSEIRRPADLAQKI